MRLLYIIYCIVVSTTVTGSNLTAKHDSNYRSWGTTGHGYTGSSGWHK